jgi:predicted O-methyltransferase YrrM
VGVIQDQSLDRMLIDLHARSDAQVAAFADFEARRVGGRLPTEDEIKAFRSDKFVALDRDKAEFCYQLCRATNARRIIEVGTSYGVSTLYLAAAVRETVRIAGGPGFVIGTEYEPQKAAAARVNFEQAGLGSYIDLREGDLQETLREMEGPIDFVLMDVWIRMARPALELIAPHLKVGAIVVCDNTQAQRGDYAAYFDYLEDPANGFRTMTLPFAGGLELSVRGAL